MNKKYISFFRIILLAAIFMQVIVSRAQEEYKELMDNIFEIPAGKIPSAAEVYKTDVNLLEINTLLLKKMEEMTLYILDLQSQINELKK